MTVELEKQQCNLIQELTIKQINKYERKRQRYLEEGKKDKYTYINSELRNLYGVLNALEVER